MASTSGGGGGPLGTLFALPPSFFEGAVADGDAAAAPPPIDAAPPRCAEPADDGGALTCRVCGIGTTTPPFPTVAAQRAHFKSDWHRLNVRRTQRGRPALDEAGADAALAGGDASSLSGSGTDDSDDGDDDTGATAGPSTTLIARGGGALAAFSAGGRRFAVWRAVVTPPRAAADAPPPPAAALASLLTRPTAPWAVILAKGGHFAAAVFDVASSPPVATHHATAHRYVVRAKAGGRQSAKDGTGKTIKSAGSSLRRYNEAALDADVRSALASFAAPLAGAALIFVHAPGQANAASLFTPGPGGAAPPLARRDARVRPVPFTVRRPTLKEAVRVARALVTVYDAPDVVAPAVEATAKPAKEAKPPPPPPPPPRPRSPSPPPESALVQAVRSGDADAVAALLAAGADPCARARGGRLPYDLAQSKPVRDAFRRAAAAAPDAADWGAAGVPSALTPEMEAAQAARAAAKKAKARERERERKAAAGARKAEKEAKAAAEAEAEVEAAAREAAALSLKVRDPKGAAAAKRADRAAADAADRRARAAAAAEARLKAAAEAQRTAF